LKIREEYRQIEIKEGLEEIVNEEDKEDNIKEELTGLISKDNKNKNENKDKNKNKNENKNEDENRVKDKNDINRCNERNGWSLSLNGKGIVRTNALPPLKGYVRTLQGISAKLREEVLRRKR
jgi:hypothetical protein